MKFKEIEFIFLKKEYFNKIKFENSFRFNELFDKHDYYFYKKKYPYIISKKYNIVDKNKIFLKEINFLLDYKDLEKSSKKINNNYYLFDYFYNKNNNKINSYNECIKYLYKKNKVNLFIMIIRKGHKKNSI